MNTPFPEHNLRYLENLAEPIDLSGGRTMHVPHLADTAMITVGLEVIAVQPEQVEPELEGIGGIGDYKFIALDGLTQYMLEQGYHGTSEERYTRAIVHLDAMTAMRDVPGLPPGVVLTHTNEEFYIGRETSPQMRLGGTVSPKHARFVSTTAGVSFEDLGSSHGTKVFLSHEDADRTTFPQHPKPVNKELKNRVFSAFSGLLLEQGGSIEHSQGELDVGVDLVDSPKTDTPRLEIIINAARDFPSLHLPRNYQYRKVTIGPNEERVRVLLKSKPTERAPGIVPASLTSELSTREAVQLLGVATEMYRNYLA